MNCFSVATTAGMQEIIQKQKTVATRGGGVSKKGKCC